MANRLTDVQLFWVAVAVTVVQGYILYRIITNKEQPNAAVRT